MTDGIGLFYIECTLTQLKNPFTESSLYEKL